MSSSEPTGGRWRAFWASPSDGAAAALLRVLVGSFMFCNALSILVNIDRYFSEEGILPWQRVANRIGSDVSLIGFAPTNDAWVSSLAVTLLVASVGMIFGCLPRLSTSVAWVIQLSFALRNPYLFNGGDRVTGLLCFFLIFAPIDRYWVAYVPRFRLRQIANIAATTLALRLIQLQIAWVYFNTGLHKLMSVPWQDGYAMRLVMRHAQFARWPADIDSVILKLATWGTIAFEVLFPLILIPRLRRPVLIAGLLFHLGIEVTMLIPSFSIAMLVGYAAFVPDDLARRWLLWLAGGWQRLGARLHRPAGSPS